MKIIDLSHTIKPDMPMFPGEIPPVMQKTLTHEKEGAQVTKITMNTHTGTHLDCPLHFLKEGTDTENTDPDQFYGKGFVIDCTAFKNHETIPADHLKTFDPEIALAHFVLIRTDWSKHWGSDEYFNHFPVLSNEAAEYLVSKKVKGIGLDVISIDAIDSSDYPNHYTTLGNNVLIIENLTNLHLLEGRAFHFAAFPLKFREGDGSPVRAVAIVD
ncbi:MAG: cyclase family protein [Bacteroidales bacterium]